MSNDNVELIENRLTSRKIEEYEIFFIDRNAYESIFLKDQVDIKREVNDLEYFIRILSQRENQTGIGIIKGNSLDPKEIERNIDICVSLSKNNESFEYFFPEKNLIPTISIADKKIIQDPLGVKEDLVEELTTQIKQLKHVFPTFGRFRVHVDQISLRNSNGIDLDAIKTYLFIEFSLKAQQKGKLSEFWPFLFFKERKHLDLRKRVEKWAKITSDTLIAKPPKSNSNAIVIFPPSVLRDAFNSIIGFHSAGRAYYEKITKFDVGKKVASENITIFDDGLLKEGFNSNGWDGEGNPRQRTEIINGGIFQKRLLDQKYAILGDTKPTGNGNRSADGTIINGISNLEILPGDLSLNEIISNVQEGFYIEKFSWLNPSELTGNFGAEIRNGYYIKNGEFQHPIKGGNLSGNVFDMLNNCQFISKEREFSVNSLFPYMCFKNLNVSY